MIALLASLRPRATDWIFSLKTFAAAMTALFIALSCGLEKPFWAMATVYIVSSPMSGALSSKAVYRVLGTIIGATATVVLVPNLVNAPELLSLVLALWVGGCLAVSLLDRTPRSYVTMLGGYTVALIGFPAVSDPGAVFDTAVARVEEIVLGITCAGLFGHLLLPRHVGPMVAGRIDAWLKDAGELTLDAFAGVTGAEARAKRARLAADATELHGLSVHLAYDHSQFRGTTGLMQALRGRMLLLLPLLGTLAYLGLNWSVTGTPFGFTEMQKHWSQGFCWISETLWYVLQNAVSYYDETIRLQLWVPTLVLFPVFFGVLLAVNRRYGRADYLPCIAWGGLAQRCAGLEVGDGVRLAGRLQSRSYTKVEDGVSQQRVAYEVSVMKLEPVELGGT